MVTGFSPAFLTYGRELRQPYDSIMAFQAFCHDPMFRKTSVSNFLQELSLVMMDNKEQLEAAQDLRREKINVQNPSKFEEGDSVLVQTHVRSSRLQGITSKLAAKREGIHKVHKEVGPTTFEVWDPIQNRSICTVHSSELTHCPEQ